MRALLISLALLGAVMATQAADAVTGQVVKVLPFLMDQQGRIAVSPSLFDRDAYQALLRNGTNAISGMRFDILWTATQAPAEKFKLVLELRGVDTNGTPKLKTFETNAVPGRFRQWTYLSLVGGDYKNFGSVVAWRATLWDDRQLLNEQKSFLW